jgi:hypothetical protein
VTSLFLYRCHGLQLDVAVGIYFGNLYYLSNIFFGYRNGAITFYLAIFIMEKEMLKVFIKEGGCGVWVSYRKNFIEI